MRYPITSSLEIPYIIVELFYDMTQIKKQIPKIKEKSKQNHDIQSYSCLFKLLKTSNLAARHGIIKKKKKKVGEEKERLLPVGGVIFSNGRPKTFIFRE